MSEGLLNLPAPFPLSARIGHGYDLHRMQETGELFIGGVLVAKELSPVAHSDGDVVLHALVDALLGAMGWGDIGELFPNNDDRWKDAPSSVFVTTVYAHVRQHGYRVQNADFMILAEKPKLKLFKEAIRASVARLLDVDGGQVNIKAGTNEGVDAIGRGEAIAAHATVLLVKE
jgi:2-C-methyl-D-erythritol 2,4-cyclodiphosphate synthase